MNYKYKKNQIFGKRLKVPKTTLKQIYANVLTIEDYFKYDLIDKVPVSCLNYVERKIVERFGIEKAKNLDWELIKSNLSYEQGYIPDIIMEFDPNIEDVNQTLYDYAVDKVYPINYSKRMIETYPDRVISRDDIPSELLYKFNYGSLSIMEIIKNWQYFNKNDLSYFLKKDPLNTFNISDNQLKEFMGELGNLTRFFSSQSIYAFINEVYVKIKNKEERQEYIKVFVEKILESSIQKYDYNLPKKIDLSNEEYLTIFNYYPLANYLRKMLPNNEKVVRKIVAELENKSSDYIYNLPIPLNILLQNYVMYFVSEFGLENIVNFDNECGQYFTSNNSERLRLMYDMYMRYHQYGYDPNKTIFTKNNSESIDKDDDRPYTKTEFYESMRRMIIYGPGNNDYIPKEPQSYQIRVKSIGEESKVSLANDYRIITGEFREKNPDLFIDSNAPQELQNRFYAKTLTPTIIGLNPDFVPFLIGKNVASCFRSITVNVIDENQKIEYENFYELLSAKSDYNSLFNFIIDYNQIINIVFDRNRNFINYETLTVHSEDDIIAVQKRINAQFRKIMIENHIAFPNTIPTSLKQEYPDMFLDDNAPEELKKVFYERKDIGEYIANNPQDMEYLKNIDLEIMFKYMPIKVVININNQLNVNLPKYLKDTFGNEEAFNIMISYGNYLEKTHELVALKQFNLVGSETKEDILNKIDKRIFDSIILGLIKYNDSMSPHFVNQYPQLFLPKNTPQEIKSKFYSREFSAEDFVNNPKLLQYFENTNLACGLGVDFFWMIDMFKEEDTKEANIKLVKILDAYNRIRDKALESAFKDYLIDNYRVVDMQKIDYVANILKRLSLSNSSEIFAFRKTLANQILETVNPIESLNKIEAMFLKNNIPTVGKLFSVFNLLHPDAEGFDYLPNSTISPTLKEKSNRGRSVVIFSDLIKASFGSNNRSIKDYIGNIEYAYNIYKSILNKEFEYSSLDEKTKRELNTFASHLLTLYNSTTKGRLNSEVINLSGDTITDITKLSDLFSPNGEIDFNLADRVISMFCHFAGIDTLDQAKQYFIEKIKNTDERNRRAGDSTMNLETGDLVKGIGDIKFLSTILQNGSVAKEFLGSSAGSDLTPLDTDVSIIKTSEGSIREKINNTVANSYGPIFFVLKNDNRFVETRNNSDVTGNKDDLSKLELFYTGAAGKDHYGIRTGFASSEINYIVMDSYDERVGLEIAMNGFYIPIANKDGEIIFTAKDYDAIRSKMSGLSRFDMKTYIFSNNLLSDEIIEIAEQIKETEQSTIQKRELINSAIKKALLKFDLELKTFIDGDLSEGSIELIDTGSTSRGTNKPGKGDFDFIMRVDKNIISNPNKINQIKQSLLQVFNKESSNQITGSGDFRLKDVVLDGVTVDIDISFTNKTDKISFSTDMALKDRLETIKTQDPERYQLVLANILLAKQVLGSASAYKPNRGEDPQGGLGGVGVENWILQHGGSFIDAAQKFLNAAKNRSFDQFKEIYKVWDFGENHLAEQKGFYTHDNFVTNNMSQEGYEKMKTVLFEYLNNIEYNNSNMSNKIS